MTVILKKGKEKREEKMIKEKPKTNNKDNICQWKLTYDEISEEEYYETSCGQSEIFSEGDIEDNHYKFCPYCGKRIREMKYERNKDGRFV